MYLNVKAIKQQVQVSLASLGVFPSVSVNQTSAFSLSTATSGFENFNQDPSCHNLAEDEINIFSNYGIHEHPTQYLTSQVTSVHKYCSQAEQAYMIFLAQKREIAPPDLGLPRGFIQQFKMKNGLTYPKHPSPPHLMSDFVVGRRSWYYCG